MFYQFSTGTESYATFFIASFPVDKGIQFHFMLSFLRNWIKIDVGNSKIQKSLHISNLFGYFNQKTVNKLNLEQIDAI